MSYKETFGLDHAMVAWPTNTQTTPQAELYAKTHQSPAADSAKTIDNLLLDIYMAKGNYHG